MMKLSITVMLLAVAAAQAGCSGGETAPRAQPPAQLTGTLQTVAAGLITETVRVPAIAEAYARATLSTKLMGTVTAVHVREGDRVRIGEPLLSIDARDLVAKAAQVEAAITEAEAMQHEAATHAGRMRALHADDAAPRAQLDAAETALARAEAAVRSARAARAEVAATSGYSVIRAPFNGVITARMVDAGAFAAPGAPLLTVQDARRLRVVATATPGALGALARGARVHVEIEGVATTGTVEGIVPTGGNLHRVNVIVDNMAGTHRSGSAATVQLPQYERSAIRIPQSAIFRSGDLTGVYVRNGTQTRLRWVQLGSRSDSEVEVLAGLRAGEEIVIPIVAAGAY